MSEKTHESGLSREETALAWMAMAVLAAAITITVAAIFAG